MKHSTNLTAEDELESFNQYKEVESALKPYIEAAKSGNGVLAQSAFYDHATFVGSIGGDTHAMTVSDLGNLVTESGQSPEIEHRIVSIDISGPVAAAKVEIINWGAYRFTDFFVLYKKNGQWKISSGVYDAHSHN